MAVEQSSAKPPLSLWRRALSWAAMALPFGFFSHMTQVVWIHQECGTPELLHQRVRICADNALRLQWGGLLGAALLLLVVGFLLWPFRSLARENHARVVAKTAGAAQLLWLSLAAFSPLFRGERFLGGVVVLFLVCFFLLMRREIAGLFENTAAPGNDPRPSDNYLNAIFWMAIVYQVVVAFIGFTNPILDHHSWRQTQTAISVHFLALDGFRLDYPTPLTGKPWSNPLEFPLYQYIAALLVRWTGLGVEAASRIVSLLSFYGCIFVLRRILKNLSYSTVVIRLVTALVLFCPLYVFFARVVLIESLATFLGLSMVWTCIEFFKTSRFPWLFILLCVSSLCALVKITTFIVFCFFLAGVFLFYLKKPFAANFTGRNFARYGLTALAGVLVPVALGLLWVRYADAVKMQNPIGEMWTSAALRTWNFGTLQQRFSPEFWQQILISRLRDLFGYLAPLVLCILLVILCRRGRVGSFWPWAGFIAYLSGPLIFPNLYYIHDYYFFANGIFLIIALGVTVGASYERTHGLALRNFRLLILFPLFFSMIAWYFDKFLPKQIRREYDAVAVGRRISELTKASDVIILHGDAAYPDIPFYARRRSLINEADRKDFDGERMQRALRNLADENIGAVIIPLSISKPERKNLMAKYQVKYGFRVTPEASLNGVEIYTK